MPHPTIQDLARRAKSAHHNYGQTDAATERLMLDVLDAIIGPDGKARAIDVDPGTLTEYAGVGIAVNCDYNSDASGRQPFVTVNTEELNIMHRYGPDHGMPAIAVHLNDATLYDDEGNGDEAQGAVRRLDDALADADADLREAIKVLIDRHGRANNTDPDYAELLADPELSEQARETLREQARAAGEIV